MPPKKRTVRPKRRHPGRAYPKPKGKIWKIGRGGKIPTQHPIDWRKKNIIPTTQRPYGPRRGG